VEDRLHGPVDYVIIEFENRNADGSMAAALLDLVDQGIVTLLDVTLVTKAVDGSFAIVDFDALDDGDFGGITVLAGARSGLIGDDDLAEAVNALTPGTSAVVIVYENTWAVPFVTAARHVGADFVASGRIPADDLVAAIDALG
jgi:uncharacterized membrane protein